MAAPDPVFVQRNSMILAFAAVIVMTFMLGLSTALLLFGGQDAPQQAGLGTQTADDLTPAMALARMQDDTAMRAQTADFTGVGDVVAGREAAQNPPAADQRAVTPLAGNELALAVLAGLRSTQQEPVAASIVPANVEPAPVTTPQERTAAAVEALGTTRLRMLREAILAGAYTVGNIAQGGVTRVRLQPANTNLKAEISAGYFTANLADDRLFALRTPDGGVDAETMMFSIVQTSLLDDATPDSTAAAREMSRRIFAASTARTQDIAGQRVYTVQPGDSLAYIALQLFGMPDAYKQILDANPDTLQSSEQIQLGQRLTIPS
jgi:nucleoid-associated protein YgaU